MTDLLAELETYPPLAKKRVRYFAAFIDYLLFFAAFIFIAVTLGESYTTDEGIFKFNVEGWPAVALFAVWFLIFPFLESLRGQTLGKLLFKIKVVKQDYTKASLRNTFARHFFDFIDDFPFLGIVGLIVASNNNLKQRVGDLVGKTIVIQK
jgi:uncharacterized RDD family membrane protein YckC